MSKDCIQCSAKQRTNQHQVSKLLPILSVTYGSANMIFDLSLPRRYTTTHNDVPPALFAAVGHNYDQCLLNSEEVRKEQTQVTGEWVKKDGKYEIHFSAMVSDANHPDAKARNEEFCRYMSGVMETIGFLEAELLRKHPELSSVRIFIHFKSTDPAYDRVEYWHRLGYWAPKCLQEKKEEPKHDSSSSDDDKKKHKKRHHSSRRPPQVCMSCQNK
jgi:hypothetical protein